MTTPDPDPPLSLPAKRMAAALMLDPDGRLLIVKPC